MLLPTSLITSLYHIQSKIKTTDEVLFPDDSTEVIDPIDPLIPIDYPIDPTNESGKPNLLYQIHITREGQIRNLNVQFRMTAVKLGG